jgi:hypothetical protein
VSAIVWLSTALIAGGAGVVVWLVLVDPRGRARGAFAEYGRALGRDVRFLML